MPSSKKFLSRIIIAIIIVAVIVIGLYIFGLFYRQATPDDPSETSQLSQLVDADPSITYTDRYLANHNYASPSLEQPELEQFIQANRGELYLAVDSEEFSVTAERGAPAMQAYLNFISGSGNSPLKLITSKQIEAAFNLLLDNNDSSSLDQLVATLESNETILRTTPIPVDATRIHAKLLGATIGLRQNLILMEQIKTDYVGGLIGARNVEDSVGVFADITWDIQQLENKFNL